MVRAETVGAGFVTFFVILIELYLLFDESLSDGLGSIIGVSRPVFEWIVFFVSVVILGVVWWAAEKPQSPY